MKTDKHFPMIRPSWANKEADMFVRPNERCMSVYPSSKGYYGEENLNIRQWIKMLVHLLENNLKDKMILIGSPWDLNMLKPIYDTLCALGYRSRVKMVHDRDIAVSIEILRRSRFLIGCVSGLSIIAEYQNVPTVHLYPKTLYSELNLLGAWECGDMVRSGKSLSLKIEDGWEKIVKQISERFNPRQELCKV